MPTRCTALVLCVLAHSGCAWQGDSFTLNDPESEMMTGESRRRRTATTSGNDHCETVVDAWALKHYCNNAAKMNQDVCCSAKVDDVVDFARKCIPGFGRFEAKAQLEGSMLEKVAKFLIDENVFKMSDVKGFEDFTDKLKKVANLGYGPLGRVRTALEVAASGTVINVQGNYNEAKRCEGSGNAGKHGGAAQVVCCSTRYGSCCAAAAFGGKVPQSLKKLANQEDGEEPGETEMTDVSTQRCPKSTFWDATSVGQKFLSLPQVPPPFLEGRAPLGLALGGFVVGFALLVLRVARRRVGHDQRRALASSDAEGIE